MTILQEDGHLPYSIIERFDWITVHKPSTYNKTNPINLKRYYQRTGIIW